METIAVILFSAHLTATLWMTGLIWFVQVVHYPLFAQVESRAFLAYERAHIRLTTWVVAPLMIAEAATGLMLFGIRPASVALWHVWVGAGLLALIWVSTGLVQSRQHAALSVGFDAGMHRRLVHTNWVRTAAWTCRGLLWLPVSPGTIV